MAKKSGATPHNSTVARIARTEAYASKVQAMFDETVKRILKLNKSLPELNDGEMYSFDAQSEKMRTEVESCLRQLHSVATAAIQQGIKLEWSTANTECDKLLKSQFGKSVLENPDFSAWTNRNGDAMRAFIARSNAGMNLSDRVWKATRQLRDEMEVAITVAVGEGTSAQSLSRSVRKYLNDPDLMFRRFRYKDPETGEWKRKWKKRVIDPATGRVSFIDYDKDSYKDEYTGRGYYKSAAMNAMRVARTETNIAYRRADSARWQQMDFVIGQRVQTSHNHPEDDICDTLAGDYPKDFVFDGWHPQCYCFVVPINLDEDTIAEIMTHDNWQDELKRAADEKRITDYPKNFKDWVRKNADNISAARERGTEPYFIRNNAQRIDEIIDPSKKKLTTLEKAAIRHENRTSEQKEAIMARWQEREQRLAEQKRINSTANRVLSVVDSRFSGIDIDTTLLKEAVKSGNTEAINAETRALAKLLSKKQQLINKTASNVMKVAAEYNEVDASALQAAISSKSLAEIQTQTKSLAKQVVKMKQAEASLADLIPDVHKWHKQFTLTELQEAYSAITKTFNRWTWDYTSETSLNFLKGKLETEIDFVAKSAYKTKEIAKKAYEQRLALVESKIELLKINKDYTALLGFKTQSKEFKEFMAYAKQAMDAGEPKTARIYLNAAAHKKASIEAAKAAKAAKKAAGKGANGYSTATQTDHPEIKNTEAEKIAQIKNMLNCTDGQAKAYYNAVNGFSYQWDWEIRQVQCGNTKFTSKYGHGIDEIKKRAENLEEFIRKSSQWKGGTTYRGLSLSDKELKDIIDKLMKESFDNKGSASWSTNYGVSERFANSHLGKYSEEFGDIKTNRVVLLLKEQNHATSIRHISCFPDEYEVLASMDCRYKFIRKEIKKRNGIDYIYITVEAI
jgi:hypothetical protein